MHDLKPYPPLCRDCKWSIPSANIEWMAKCLHPQVNGSDPWVLSSMPSQYSTFGSEAIAERSKRWTGKCGMKGRLWEPREADHACHGSGKEGE